MTSVLSAHDLGKSFGAVVAASGLSMEVPAGQRVSLIGSNGAGKTTFVNMVTGYLKPDTGRILLEGRDITALAPRRISRMGVSRSFQIPQLCIELTALENMLVALAASDPGGRLSFWKPAHADDQRIRAEELLDRFGLNLALDGQKGRFHDRDGDPMVPGDRTARLSHTRGIVRLKPDRRKATISLAQYRVRFDALRGQPVQRRNMPVQNAQAQREVQCVCTLGARRHHQFGKAIGGCSILWV